MMDILRGFLVLLILISAGCKDAEPVALDPAAQQDLADFDQEMDEREKAYETGHVRIADPNVIVASHSVEISPATLPDTNPVELEIASPPEQVCREFLNSLRDGDRESARQLLTPAAQIATTRAKLELDAPGDQDTVFTVMQPRYATLEQLVAEVDCLFHRDDFRGESVKLTWMMRRQNHGWKISGMLIDMGSGELDLLSFENATDLARIQQSVSDEPGPTRQSSVPASTPNYQ